MEEFKLKQEVTIKQSGVRGRVIGIWFSAYGEPQYYVRYFDQNDRPGDFWFAAEEIEASAKS